MVEFKPAYYNALDRAYGVNTPIDEGTSDVDIGVKEIGQSIVMGISGQGAHAVATKIKHGAGAIDIQFIGAGPGRRGSETPDMYGWDQRQAIKELAEINEIDLTTHSTTQVFGLSGLREDRFSEESRKAVVDEIKRAIEFAADIRGGSVTVHTGEFPRAISEAPWNQAGEWKGRFRQYEEEPEKAAVRVVDSRTGRILAELKKDNVVYRPKWLTADHDYQGYDEQDSPVYIKKGDFIDYENRLIGKLDNRVPEYDAATGRFKTVQYRYEDFVKEAELRSKAEGHTVTPEEAFVQASIDANAAQAKGWALHHSKNFKEIQENLEKLKKAREIYTKIEAGVPEEEKWKLLREVPRMARDFIPPEHKYPTEIIDEHISTIRREMEFSREAAIGYEQQAKEQELVKTYMKPIKDYAVEQSHRSYAEAGMKALLETQKKNPHKPVYIAMEHIFPEQYGGHPEELLELVKGARNKMTDMLKQKGYKDEEAKKLSENHIKATLDTGHINIWRKYWVDDPNKNPEQNEKEFSKWAVQTVEKLAKEKVWGNVHLTDNFGYNDDHLAPGMGTTPVKEMVYVLKKHGYDAALTVEPAADAAVDLSDFHGLMKAWRLFGSPVYAAHTPTATIPKRWGDIQYGYFGQAAPPYYIFGSYAPSNEWTLWSQVPFE